MEKSAPDTERVNILDDSGQVIATLSREEAEAGNHTTPNVLIFIFNAQRQLLIARRASTKKYHPNCWDISACGGVTADEDPLLAARRETEQETGIDLGENGLHFIETFLNEFEADGVKYRRLSRLFIAFSDQQPVPKDGEVSEFKYWDVDPFRTHATEHPDEYVPSFMAEFERAIAGIGHLS